ncbi:MAG: exosome complex protein Rrp42 [Methanobacteriota archaeon]|nr:MAG: exosome complex protein Rrp42 [Euryarchaeota archaeon]
MTEVVSELTRNHIHRLASDGKRVDGRAPDEFRPLKIEKSFVHSAEGSARVHLGNTDVLIGIKMDLGEPYADTPNKGVLTTSAELIPMASPDFESGPPRESAIELARVVDRGIRETETVDLEKLCIEPGEKVWILFLDMHILDFDGNLFDACSFGALSALTDTTVPASRTNGEDFKLEVEHYPVSVTAVKIGRFIFLDPSLDEEMVADARLTVAIDENGDIRAMQKGLSGSFTFDEVEKVIELATLRGNEIRETIKG